MINIILGAFIGVVLVIVIELLLVWLIFIRHDRKESRSRGLTL